MNVRGDLADPAWEPSDEELTLLLRDAFAGLVEAREESLRAMRARIDALEVQARARLAASLRGASGG